METFVLVILAVLAVVVLFWLLIYPGLLLGGAAVAILKGMLDGWRPTRH